MSSIPVRVGIVGDYHPANHTQRATTQSLEHSAKALGVEVQSEWLPTGRFADPARVAEQLEGYHGLICACGSPYASMDGALAAIRFARENNRVFLGNCGGFQHMVIEFARNVLGIPGAEHEETSPNAQTLIINRLSCSLVGRAETVRMIAGMKLREIYGREIASEEFWCNFGINSEYIPRFEAGGMRLSAVDSFGQARAAELSGHAFFLGTLFIPGLTSTEASPHPVVTAFVQAVAAAR